MQAIFGEQEASDMFKAEIDILWSEDVEDRFSAGQFCIVSDIPNELTIADSTYLYTIQRQNLRRKFPDDTSYKQPRRSSNSVFEASYRDLRA